MVPLLPFHVRAFTACEGGSSYGSHQPDGLVTAGALARINVGLRDRSRLVPCMGDVSQAEMWRPVPGRTEYEVSSLGRVRTQHRELRRSRTSAGYYTVTLRAATTYVHHLVAEAFIGPRPVGAVVRHGRGGSLDNSTTNLSYGSQSDNLRDGVEFGAVPVGEGVHNARLTDGQVRVIRDLHAVGGYSYRQLAAAFEVGASTIAAVVRGRTWTHV